MMNNPACAPNANPPLDLVELHERSPAEDLKTGRELCTKCPELVECRSLVLTDGLISGMVAGMLPSEREEYRAKRGVATVAPQTIDVFEGKQLSIVSDDLPEVTAGQRIPKRITDFVIRLTKLGHTAAEIVETINQEAVTVRMVEHIRFSNGVRGD